MMYSAILTQKGQVTIPIDLRQFLGIKPYTKVTFVKEKEQVVIKPAVSFLDLKGSVKSPKKAKRVDMDKAVQAYIGKEYVKK